MISADSLENIPKIELHAHLNGSLTIDSLKKLIKLSNNPNISVPKLLTTPTSMDEVFKLFPLIQAVTTTYAAVKQATIDVISDFAREKTVYLELRTTPKVRPELSKQNYIKAVLEGIRECSALPITVRLLLSIDRRQSIEEAEETLQMVQEDETGLVVGLDLSGDPSIDGRKFLPILRKAKAAGLKLAIHLAEIESCLEEVDDFLALKPDRIGHGTFLHKKDCWVKTIVENRIPFEICLTSNIMSQTSNSATDSHLGFWKGKGLPVAICTDDSGMIGTTLTKEYQIAQESFDISLKKVLLNSLEMSFLSRESKEFRNIQKIIEALK